MSKLSRRKVITNALASAGGLAVASSLADRYGLLPPDCRGLYGPGDSLTFASHRLLTANSLAREFPPSAISPTPFAKLRPFHVPVYDRLRAGGFVDWQVHVEGLVARPGALSLAAIKSMPARTQITQLACEEGWSFIAEWTGVPLARVLSAVGILPQARFVVYFSAQPNWWQSIDLVDALHPQTLLVYGMNGADLTHGHGAPLRLSLPRQLGYKSVKFINRLVITDSLERFPKRGNYSWYAGI